MRIGPACYSLGVQPGTSALLSRPVGLFALFAVALLLGACAPRSEIRSAQRIGDVRPPEFRLVEGQTAIERFDPPGAGGVAALAVGARVQNPNDFPVRLTGVDYVVLLENRQVARASLAPDMLLAAQSSAPLRFDLETPLRDRPELLRAVVRAFTGRPLLFRIEGRLTFDSLAYEFRTNQRLLLEGSMLAREEVRPPSLRLDEEQSEAYLLSPDVPVVRLAVTATNPGDVGYFLYGKDLTLALGGHAVATDDMRPVPVPAGASTRVDVIFYPRREAIGEEARAALTAALNGLTTAVELSGDLSMDVLGVDAFAVPDGWRLVGFIHSDSR